MASLARPQPGLKAFLAVWPALAGALLMAAAWEDRGDSLTSAQLLLGGLLLALTVVAELAPVRVEPNHKASLASVPMVLAALLLPPAVAGLAAGIAILAGNLGTGRRFVNALFNGATASIAVTITGLVASPFGLGPSRVSIAVLGCGLFSLLSLAAPATASALARSEPIGRRILSTLASNWAQAAALDAIAITMAVLALAAPLLLPLPLLVLPLVVRVNAALEGQLAANEGLEKVLAAQRKFLSDVSHNVGNPLSTIRTNLHLLQSAGLGRGHRRALEDTHAEALRLSHLFQRLRILAETDEGMPLKRGRLDLTQMADELARAYTGEAGRRGVELIREPSELTPVDADEDLLRQAAANLIENAIRLTPRGKSVTLRVSANDRLARFEVIDEGPGIEPGLLPDIFERFKKGPDGGSGLGLAIARSVVERHGGQIRVESSPGLGARFEIRLPRASLAS